MRVVSAFGVLLWLAAVAAAAPSGVARLDRIERPPAGWRGEIFEPSFSFPVRARAEARPWQAISFRKDPKRYLSALLAYALDGQDRTHWRLRANKARGWYHVPWLGPGPNGREFIHGLTRAHDLAPGTLGAKQIWCRQSWAIAFYNSAGGAVLGRVWRRVAQGRGGPDLDPLPFPVGTVAVKLVFTDASANDDARLTGAPELEANIHSGSGANATSCASAIDTAGTSAKRSPQTLRLVQFDIAVREDRANYKTGWVYASFIYDGRRGGGDPWAKLVPVGLMWGNDPQLSDNAVLAGAEPRQSIVFDGQVFGRGGRMNGITDERSSACSSCHMAAQWPSVTAMTAPADWREAKCWFRNLDARYPFGFAPTAKEGCSNTAALTKTRALDFSLQLAIGLRNWSLANVDEGKAVRTSVGRIARKGQRLTVDGMESIPLRR